MRLMLRLGLLVPLLGCGDEPKCDLGCIEPVVVAMDYTAQGFFDAPFPSDARRDADGRPIVAGFPNPLDVSLVGAVLSVIQADARGFGLSSGTFFRLSGELDAASLPSLEESVTREASVQLVSVGRDSPDFLKRYPIRVSFAKDGGPYGAENLLALVPLQGTPLLPRTPYVAIVTAGVLDRSGRAIGVADALERIRKGEDVDGMSATTRAAHTDALEILEEDGVTSIVALTLFTTDDPTETLGLAIADAKKTLPILDAPLTLVEEFPGYCVYASTLAMPNYQAGSPPYLMEGGGWELDDAGTPKRTGEETARIVVTIPKTTMPEAGFPFVVFSRTGGGGDRPLVDRGAHAVAGGAAEPGSGPAREFAGVGHAGVSVDGPHGGMRNVSGDDEQFLVFNFQNPLALRDNIRQSALELAILPDTLESVTLDTSGCVGAPAVSRLDVSQASIMGHSMGASIAPLALVFEPKYRAILLSGVGGSFLENMLHKQKPLAVKGLAELLLGLSVPEQALTEASPILSMLQWAGEPADNPLYGRYVVSTPLVGGPRHVLMMQGIVDHYNLPPIANATSLSFGLDLGGAALDETIEEIATLPSLASLLSYSGREILPFPIEGNAASGAGEKVTAVVVQYPEDGIEDGHEAVFQTAAPKHAYACFLKSLAEGSARVPRPGTDLASCD